MIVSVIIPVRNRVHLIEAAIHSLLRQRGPFQIDVVVVDDGSTDGTAELLGKIERQFSSVRAFFQDCSGIAAARNKGLANLRPDTSFVSFLDSDDLCIDQRFERDISLFSSYPNLDAIYGRAIVTDKFNASRTGPDPNAQTADIVTIHVGCALIRAETIEYLGGFHTSFIQGEDTDFLLRLFESGARIMQSDTKCCYYLRHPGNITNQSDESHYFFLKALQNSRQRKSCDPSIRLKVPQFDFSALRATELYGNLDSTAVEIAISKLADGRIKHEREYRENNQGSKHQVGLGAPVCQ